MKSKCMVVLLALASAACAQSKPATAQPAASPFAKKPAPVAQQQPVAAKPAPAKPTAAVPRTAAKPSSKPSASGRRASVAKPAEHKAAPELRASAVPGSRGRDPFVSPIKVHKPGSSAPCMAGKRCVPIAEMSFQGVIRSPEALIAVVVAGEKTYFLRENEPVFNGVVTHISDRSITFRERFSDSTGRKVSVRDVVKKLPEGV